MISHLSHLAIAVPDLDAAVKRMRDVYGLVAGAYHVNEQQGVRMAYVELGAAGARMELMEPLRADSAVGRFIQRHPAGGLHHLALAVQDLDAATGALAAQGVQPVSPPSARNAHGERIAFLHPRDFLGVLVELEEPADCGD